MSARDQKRAGAVVGATGLLVLLVLGGLALWAWRYPRRALRPDDAAKVRFTVSKRMTAAAIGRALAERGIIDHPSLFRFYATERGDSQKIKPGQYQLSASMSPKQIIDAIVAGVPDEEVAVTLPEGKNILEVAQLLDEAGACPKADFERAARDRQLLDQLGISGESAEGYLFPDRYQFRPGTPAAKVLTRLVRRQREVFAELREQHKATVEQIEKSLKWGDGEIVTMASMVEKETAAPDERPRIAGVFYNRLKLPTFKPHRLETDPTIVYGCTVPVEKSEACQKWDGRIHKIHLTDPDNPYNTYTHEGMPPGPISNPGRAALEAAMKPDTTAYLYFVSKNDGTHYFSKTRAEHEAAVDKYQRGK